MSTIWTPGGEHEVPRDRTEAAASDLEPGISLDAPELDPEVVEEIAALEAELLAAPVEEVIANHCYGLFQLSALHLGQRPPNLTQAKLAIDALGYLVDGLGDGLGSGSETLRDGLAQLRLAFVKISAVDEGATEN